MTHLPTPRELLDACKSMPTLRTAIVHRQLVTHAVGGARGDFAPLTADDLAWARDNLLAADRRLVPALALDLRACCLAIGAPQYAEVFATALLTPLEVELATLEAGATGTIDLTRVGSVLTVQRVAVWLKTGLHASA